MLDTHSLAARLDRQKNISEEEEDVRYKRRYISPEIQPTSDEINY